MAQIAWDLPAEHRYETGVDQVVLFVDDEDPVAWPGILSIVERVSGGEPRPYYIDGVKYLNLVGQEEFVATIEALYSPAVFDWCDGGRPSSGVMAWQQERKAFCLVFRTVVGNATEGQEYGYQIHIVYNALAEPTTRSYLSNSDRDLPQSLSWDISSTPVEVPGFSPTSHITLDSTKAEPWALSRVEDILYGTDDTDPRIPTPQEIFDIFGVVDTFNVVDNEDGTFSVTGPDEAVHAIDAHTFLVSWSTVIDHGDGTFTASSE